MTSSIRYSWALTLAEARHRGHVIELAEGGRVRCSPEPAADLLEALRNHRDRIAAFLADEATHLQQAVIEASWRALGDGWWEDPATGHLYWRDQDWSVEHEDIAWGSTARERNP